MDVFAPLVGQLSVAIVNFVATVIVGFWAYRAKKNSAVVRDQVENEHQNSPTPNLRDDLDAKERAAEARDKQRKKQLEAIEHALHEVKHSVELLFAGYSRNRDDIDGLMDTEKQRQIERSTWGPPPETRRERRERHG